MNVLNMYWFHFNLCLIVLALVTPYIVSGDESRKTNFNADEEPLPLEQTVDFKGGSKMESTQADKRLSRQSFMPNINSNMGGNTGFQFPQEFVPNVQDSSASNKVVLVLDNDKNKFPAEESLKRLARNPDAIDDIIGQFQQFGGGMTQQLLQQVSQTAPDISKSFGQALNEVLAQTNLLAQVAPLNLNFTQMREDSSQSNLPGSMDLGQLGQSLSHNFLLGATQNLFNPIRGRTGSEGTSDSEASAMPGRLGVVAPSANIETSQGTDVARNPFVGRPFLSHLRPLPQFKPFGMFAHFPALSPLMPSGSDISEVRVLPEQYSPYKVSPKEVDLQTMAEMKLRAVLKEAVTKKTIPILWFHLPTNRKLQKDKEDVEMETKLQLFEQQVIAELKQLQELASMANEVKKAQLQGGAQPTTSLTTKLNLFEIPIYDITLGDIEKTLKDEHVMMLMQTLFQKENKDFQHQQATTKYVTDLTGTPIKRQVKTSEDILKTMEKDDMMKMMSYAYRMASLNGHEMPWLKKKNMTSFDEKETTKFSGAEQQQKQQSLAGNPQTIDERKWLEDKQQQMTTEEAKQRQMFSNVQRKMDRYPMRHWVDPIMMQQQIPRQRQMVPLQTQQQMPVQTQMISPQTHQQTPAQTQMISPQTHQEMPVQTQMVSPQTHQQMPVQTQMVSPQTHQQTPVQTQMISPQTQPQMAVQTQMVSPQTHQQMPVQTQMVSPQTHQQMPVQTQMVSPQTHQKMPVQTQMLSPQTHQQTPVQTQMISPRTQAVQTQITSSQEQQMPVQTHIMPPQMQQPMAVEGQMMSSHTQHKMPAEMQMVPPQMQQPMPVDRQMMPPQMEQQMLVDRQIMFPQMIPTQMQQQRALERQMLPPQNLISEFDVPMQRQHIPRQILPLEMQQHNQMFETEMQMLQQDPLRQMHFPVQQRNQMLETEMLMQQQANSRQMMQLQFPQMQQQMFDFEMQRQDNPLLQQQRMMTNFNMGQPMLTQSQQQQPIAEMQRMTPEMQLMAPEMQRMEPEMQHFHRNMADIKIPEMNSGTEHKSEQEPSVETNVAEKATGSNTENMSNTEPTATLENIEKLTEQKQTIEAESPEKQTAKDVLMDNTPIMTTMPENDGKARFKGVDNLFDTLGLTNQRPHHFSKELFTSAGISYHNHGGHYPPIRRPPPPIYDHNSYPHRPHYHKSVSYHSHGSPFGGYRSATGDEDIANMMQQQQQQQSNSNMMMLNKNEFTTTTATKNDKSKAAHLIKNQPKSNSTSSPSPLTSTTPIITTSSSSSSRTTSSSSSLRASSNDSGPDVASLFAYEPYILKPFLGLHTVDRPNDPWHYKAYNLHQPLYTGGGTFEKFIETGRHKRDLESSPSLSFSKYAKNANILTPEMLGRLLSIKSNFKNNYPLLYKKMMDQLAEGKKTTISVTLPEVPKHVSHRNLELAAAEINPMESLIQTYEDDLRRIKETQKQRQQQHASAEALINSYKNEFNLWGNSYEGTTSKRPTNRTQIEDSTTEASLRKPHPEDAGFWEDPQNILEKFEEKQAALGSFNKFKPYERPEFQLNTQDALKVLRDPTSFFENSEHRNKLQFVQDASQEMRNNPHCFWEFPHETFNTLVNQPELFIRSQHIANEESSPRKILPEVQSNVQNAHSVDQKIQASENMGHNVRQPSSLQKRSSFWTDVEASEEQKDYTDHRPDDLENIFDFDEDFH